MTVDQINEKYKHLFETFEDGRIVRGYELGDNNPWEPHAIAMLDQLNRCRERNLHWDNPDYDINKPAGIDNYPCIKGRMANIKIFQIKEKFGDARVYITVDNPKLQDAVNGIVTRFETLCSVTCSNCGKADFNLKATRGWIQYICEECMNKENNQ